MVGPECELWLDGGHNDSGGEVLARQAALWTEAGRPLDLVCGMLATKRVEAFLQPLAPYVRTLRAVPIAGDPRALPPEAVAAAATRSGTAAGISPDLDTALRTLAGGGGRILICGSLHLAGQVLERSGLSL